MSQLKEIFCHIMKINAERVKDLRIQRAWSQEELAIASGLNLRTIQRIENQATASLQSRKSLAAAFDIDTEDLEITETAIMQQYEYKTRPIRFSFGLFKKGTSNVDTVLNEEAKQGWRLRQMIMPAESMGGSEQMVAILERRIG